jgi:hypothetical protein
MVEDMRSPGWFRIMRAWLFAMVSVGLSVAGHDLMAPRPVPVWSTGLALGLVATAGYRLADRERSMRWILVAVETVQLYLHVWFAWTTPAGSAHVTTGGDPGTHLMISGHGASMVMTHGGMSAPGMFLAHALAGAFVAVWLSAGERALWRALRSLAWTVSSHLGWILAAARPAAIPARPVHSARRDDDAPIVEILRHAVIRRGPPRSLRISTVFA